MKSMILITRAVTRVQTITSDEKSSHLVADVYFDVGLPGGTTYTDVHLTVSQPFGSIYHGDLLEIGRPQKTVYPGPWSHHDVAEKFEDYYRYLIGESGWAIRLQGAGRYEIENCEFRLPYPPFLMQVDQQTGGW